jgi:hypothetical protein
LNGNALFRAFGRPVPVQTHRTIHTDKAFRTLRLPCSAHAARSRPHRVSSPAQIRPRRCSGSTAPRHRAMPASLSPSSSVTPASCHSSRPSPSRSVQVGLSRLTPPWQGTSTMLGASTALGCPSAVAATSTALVWRATCCAENAYCKHCSGCFKGTLQVFYTDVAKVDQDVAYVATVCARMLKSVCSQCFICFSDVCCNCIYLDVAYV